MTDQKKVIISEGKSVTEYSKALKLLGYDFRRNVLKGEQYRQGESEWQSFKDGDIDNIFLDIENRVLLESSNKKGKTTKPFTINLTRDRMAMNAWFRRNEFNPFKEYLEQLTQKIPEDEGYGGDYEAEYLLSKLFDLDHQGKYSELKITPEEAEDYTRQNFMRFIIGVIDRTLNPGCEHETMPVWVSGQGAGKSVTLSKLLPPHVDGFLRGISLNLPQRSFIQSCQRGIIIEHMETTIPGGKAASAEQKERISNSSPVLDLKYDKFPSEHPLHYLSIGTTNELEFNTFDPSGDRRINPILLSQKFCDNNLYENLTNTIDEWRDRLRRHRPLRAARR